MKSSELLGKKVVIAPFSTEAIFLYHQLIHDGIEVIAFMDKDPSLHNSSYRGTMIIPYFHFEGEDIVAVIAKPGYIKNDAVICEELLAVNYKQNEIVRQEDVAFCCNLKQLKDEIDLDGLSKIRNLDWMYLIKEKNYQYTVENGFSVHALNLLVTTRCSLKCRGCCALMDYFHPQNQKDMDLEDTIRSFDLLMSHVDFVNEVVPIGGEPFLYQNIDKLLLHLVNSEYTKKIGQIFLITNGTVLPDKSTLKLLGENRHLCRIALSDYGKCSPKRLEFVSLLNQYGCTYQNHVHDIWYLTNLPVVPQPGLTQKDIKSKCDKCDCRAGGRLKTVGKKIYSCHFVAFAAECHAIPEDKRDYLDIDRDEISKESLKQFVEEIHPGMAYCGSAINKNKKDNILIPVGEQVTAVADCVRYE